MDYPRRVKLATVCVIACAAAFGLVTASGQPGPAAIPVEPSPEIAGVIKGGTRPQVIATGLNGADDPIWIPGVGLVFTEVNADRIVRVSDSDMLSTFVGSLHRPLGMTFGAQGRLISLQSEAGFTSVR